MVGLITGAALITVISGPLALMQCVAWVMMVHDFSKTGSISQAVGKTFDGHHLCPMCQKLIKARAAQEKAPITMKVGKKPELFISGTPLDLPPRPLRPVVYWPYLLNSIPECFFAPPVPVPIVQNS
jgi:hypothetical protein